MVRIAGIDIQDSKKVKIGLTKLYGIGRSNVLSLLSQASISPEKKGSELNQEELVRIQQALDKNFAIEGDLRRKLSENISRLKAIGAYRGIRHSKNLPVRGQRTKSNARTKRGKRKTIGAIKKEMQTKVAPKTASTK